MTQIAAMTDGSRTSNTAERWNAALSLTIANAALFFFLSLAMFLMQVRDITYPTIVEVLFAVGSLVCFLRLLRSGGELAALTFFVLAAGVYFGLGTMYSTILVSNWFVLLFSPDDQWRLLNKINLLNSVSCVVLFSVARLLCLKNATAATSVDGIAQITALISPLRRPLLFLSFPIVLILFAASFPEPENPVWRTPFLLMQAVADSAILICGVQWSRLSFVEKCVALTLIAALCWIGILRLSKLDALLPVAAWLGGLMLDARSSVRLIVIAAVTVIVAFLVLAILANSSRGNYAYRPNNTRAERASIVADTFSLATTAVTSSAQGSSDTLQLAFNVLNRFGDAPIQGFIINRYDNGMPGETLQGAWQILIPRVLWPGKPDISHYGLDLDSEMTDRKSTTFIGPTFSAEAYWNGGWLYVLLVSAFIGLEVGWFTHKWNRFRDEGLSQVGALIFAVPIVANTTLLETWFALTYVGLATGLVVLVYVGDALGPLLARLVGGRTELVR